MTMTKTKTYKETNTTWVGDRDACASKKCNEPLIHSPERPFRFWDIKRGKMCSEINWESWIQKLKENEAEKREENPNEKWFGDTNIFGSFLTEGTFHIYSSGALMYLQPVFRAFVQVRQRSGRGEFSGNNFRLNSLRNECTDGSKVAPELIIRLGLPKLPRYFHFSHYCGS